ncbi:endonuclease V [Nocardioides immobilis]|uniref:Endonuclease V n=1 Tax=Nocardioides immobilis TaxID=2049295 RepID=A0A417XW92_9ACTN|nr:endonuclease V [Nocardioides immobilis]RHW24682.1 endonuclease V [Nocardioides immobilis]
MWPTRPEQLVEVQRTIAMRVTEPWVPGDSPPRVAACWVCFPRGLAGPGAAGDQAWAAVVAMQGGRVLERHTTVGRAGAAYTPGLLALRVGALFETVVGMLVERPDVLLLDGTGRDHPRRCGLAVHLGAVLDLPTVGVTHRPLVASGAWPADEDGASSALRIERPDGEEVGRWLRTRAGTRPVAVHAGWRTHPATAVAVVRTTVRGRRTPEPLRRSRQLARRARAAATQPT